MYFIYLLLTVIAVTSVTCEDGTLPAEVYIYDLEDAEYHFNEFIKKFEKNYGEEYEYRFGIFKQNLKKINELNLKQNFNFHGITRFTDRTQKEFMDFASCVPKGYKNFTNVNVINLDSVPDTDYPAELDYRNQGWVSEVKNQMHCRDCFIFSAVGNIEGQYAKTYGQLYSLSEQEILDCMTPQGCSSGGYPVDVMQQIPVKVGGLVTEADYPYQGQQSTCTLNKNQIVAHVTTGNLIQGGENSLIQALNMYGPLSVAISVNDALEHWTNNNRVFNDPTCSAAQDGYHAVLLIGYGTDPSDGPYWLIKNSWGTQWGDNGYFRMARGVSMCGIGSDGVATATIG